jgi:hypothetical protein
VAASPTPASPLPTPSASSAPTATKPAAGTYTSEAAAEAYVQTQADPGFPFTFLSPQSTWNPGATLHVLHATPQGTASYGGDYYFFFVSGNAVGRQVFAKSVGERLVDPTTFSVTYQVYVPGNPHCCPAGGQATVRLHWDGHQVRPLDPMTGATQS